MYRSKLYEFPPGSAPKHEVYVRKGMEFYHTSPFERRIGFSLLHLFKSKGVKIWPGQHSSISQCVWLDNSKWLCLLGRCWHISFWDSRFVGFFLVVCIVFVVICVEFEIIIHTVSIILSNKVELRKTKNSFWKQGTKHLNKRFLCHFHV